VIVRTAGLGPRKTMLERSSRDFKIQTSPAVPKLSKGQLEREKLATRPRWVPDTKTDWPTDCRSKYKFDFELRDECNLPCGGW
jgi:hypothetical protein